MGLRSIQFPNIIIDNWGPSLRRSWPILSPLVYEYRQMFEAEEYWDDFEWLVKEMKG